MNGNTLTINVRGTHWMDRYGNTYHRAYATVNGNTYRSEITYGYGTQYMDTAKVALAPQIPAGTVVTWIDDGYNTVSRKRDL